MRPLSCAPLLARIASRTALLAALLLAVFAPVASADYHDAIRDCNDDGVLQGHYSVRTLEQARNHLPSSLREYSDCADVLAAAIARSAKGGGAGGDPSPQFGDPRLTTGSGAIAPDQPTLDKLKQQSRQSTNDHAAPPVKVADRSVTPGTAGLFHAASTKTPNHIPDSLLIALIALGVTSALAGLLLLRYRWPETRHAALRLIRR